MLKQKARTEIVATDESLLAALLAQEATVNEFLSKLPKGFAVEVDEFYITITADDDGKLVSLAAEAIEAFKDAYLVDVELQSDMLIISAEAIVFTEEDGFVRFDIEAY